MVAHNELKYEREEETISQKVDLLNALSSAIDAKVEDLGDFLFLEFASEKEALMLALHSSWNRFPSSNGHRGIPYMKYFFQNRLLLGMDSLSDHLTEHPTKNLFLVKPENPRESEFEVRKRISGFERLRLPPSDLHELEMEFASDISAAETKKPLQVLSSIQLSAKEKGLSEDDYAVCYLPPGEPFYGVLASFALVKEGWIVTPFVIGLDENLITKLLPVPGSPDIVALKIPELQDKLTKEGITERPGFFFAELLLLPLSHAPKLRVDKVDGYAAVLEIESTSSQASAGRRQLQTYMASGFFDLGILSGPEIARAEHDPYGLITWDRKGTLTKIIPQPSEGSRHDESVEIAVRSLERFLS